MMIPLQIELSTAFPSFFLLSFLLLSQIPLPFMQLRDIENPRQRILGLRINKQDMPFLKMSEMSDSDSDDLGQGECWGLLPLK